MPLQNSLWIGASSPCESPIISREFTIDAPVASATLRITALGFFEAIINGKPVTEYTFLPVPSANQQAFYTLSRTASPIESTTMILMYLPC